MSRIRTLLMSVFVSTCTLNAGIASAAETYWPSKPIKLVVTGGTGGVIDIRARWLAERISPMLGQPVIVENKPAGGGNVAMEAVARSAADGYTLVTMGMGSLVANPFLYDKLPYDPLKDFIPITRNGVGPFVLVVNPKLPVHSVNDLVQLAKSQPGALSFSAPGIGTPPHLSGELFKRAAGIDVISVQYPGGQSLTDVMGGQVTFTMEGMTITAAHAKSGRLKALAVTSRNRSPNLPDVPTMIEAGFPDFEVNGWTAIAAPAGTPKAIIDKLYAAMSKALTSDDAKKWYGELNNQPGGDTPEAFAEIIRAEYARWGKLIKATGMKAE
jgi:tripartite-type tricarboxylate transporter receptor subunit TctC